MAVAYRSHSTSNANSTTATYTKPTGLAVGDFMVAINIAASNLSVITPASGFTLRITDLEDYANYEVYTKVADSADVAASNFVFTSSSGNIMGMLYAFSGVATSLVSYTTGNPYSNPAHVIVIGAASDNDGTTATFSGYTVTGGASVTFTERFDDTNTTGLDIGLGVADGAYASTSNITAFDVTINASYDDSTKSIIILPGVTDATGTNATFEIAPTIFSNTAVEVGTIGTNATFEVSPTINSQSGDAMVPTTWTTITKS